MGGPKNARPKNGGRLGTPIRATNSEARQSHFQTKTTQGWGHLTASLFGFPLRKMSTGRQITPCSDAENGPVLGTETRKALPRSNKKQPPSCSVLFYR
jgi:hypothetical protein